MFLAHASISEKFFHCAHVLSGVPIKVADSLASALALDDGDKESAMMLFISLFLRNCCFVIVDSESSDPMSTLSHDLSAELFSAARP